MLSFLTSAKASMHPSRFLLGTVSTLSLLAPNFVFSEEDEELNFVHDVVPILTKAHCNSGACHAKADVGQRGFRLSLLGFEPQEDYEHIVKEAKGRRVFPNAPEQSLFLLKATNTVPHGGGNKLARGSEEYKTLVKWIG